MMQVAQVVSNMGNSGLAICARDLFATISQPAQRRLAALGRWTEETIATNRVPRVQPLDPIEVRRQLTALRSLHSDDRRIIRLLNRLLVKVAYLSEPKNRAHVRQLRQAIIRIMDEVEAITSDTALR
jgi:hypothetical protein